MPWYAIDRQNGQVSYIHQTVLAGKRERPSGGLLLREAADLVIKRVVNGYPAVDFDCQTSGLPEIGVTNVVLGAGACGLAEIRSVVAGHRRRRPVADRPGFATGSCR